MARTSRRQRKLPLLEENSGYQTGAYVRISDKDKKEDTSESIKNQQELLRDFISKNPELNLKRIFIDDGKSGTNFDRQGFQELMKEVKEGRINCIVVKDLSRFGRNYLETGNYIENIFPFLGVRFIAVTDHFDTLTCTGAELAYLLPLKNMMNENYARDISRKERTAKAVLRKKGCYLGGYAIYGYEKAKEDKHKLVIDPNAAKIVQLIFNMVEEGYSDIAIAKYLNAQNIPCPARYKLEQGHENKGFEKAKYWYKQTILRITTSRVYTGCVVQGVRMSKEIKGKREIVDEKYWDIVEDTHEPIISLEQFERVQGIRKHRREKYEQTCISSEKNKTTENIWKGLVFCADCKKAMLRTRVKDCKDQYRLKCSTYEDSGGCSQKYVREEELMKTVYSVLKGRIELSGDISKILINHREDKEQKRFDEELERAEKEQKKLYHLKSLLYKDFKEGVLDKSEYLYMKEKYEKDIMAYNQHIETISVDKRNHFELYSSENQAIKTALDFEESALLSAKMLKSMVEKIEIFNRNQISIRFKFQDDFEAVLQYAKDLKVNEDA